MLVATIACGLLGFVALAWSVATLTIGGRLDREGDPEHPARRTPEQLLRRARRRIILAIPALLVCLLLVVSLAYARPLVATPVATAALLSSASVRITERLSWYEMAPTREDKSATRSSRRRRWSSSPGARVDPRAYAHVLRPLAEAGYLVAVLKEPFGFVRARPRPRRDRARRPPRDQVLGRRRALARRGDGGVVRRHRTRRSSGLVLFASYPATGSTRTDLKVASVSGSADGLSHPGRHRERRRRAARARPVRRDRRGRAQLVRRLRRRSRATASPTADRAASQAEITEAHPGAAGLARPTATAEEEEEVAPRSEPAQAGRVATRVAAMSETVCSWPRTRWRRPGSHQQAIDVFTDYYRQLEEGVTGLHRRGQHRAAGGPGPARAMCRSVSEADAQPPWPDRDRSSSTAGWAPRWGWTRPSRCCPYATGRDLPRPDRRPGARAPGPAYGVKLPLIFMNSFRTHDDTLAALGRYDDLAGRRSRPGLRAEPGAQAAGRRPDPGGVAGRPEPGVVPAGPRRPLHRRCVPRGCSTGCWSWATATPRCPTPTTSAPPRTRTSPAGSRPAGPRTRRRSAGVPPRTARAGTWPSARPTSQLILRDTAQTAKEEMHLLHRRAPAPVLPHQQPLVRPRGAGPDPDGAQLGARACR